MQKFFQENGYVVIKNFLDPNTSLLLNRYCKTVVQSVDFKSTYFPELHHAKWDGTFGDVQIPGMTFHRYGDPMFDTLLELSTNAMESYTGLQLNPNYAYWRWYQKGDVLKRHSDRDSCEISTTLCLGYDVSDVDSNIHPDYNWELWIADKQGNEIPIHMNPGDMVVYKGCVLDHWRNEFPGKWHNQVFMHYSDKNGPFNVKYDGRPFLGIPLKND